MHLWSWSWSSFSQIIKIVFAHTMSLWNGLSWSWFFWSRASLWSLASLRVPFATFHPRVSSLVYNRMVVGAWSFFNLKCRSRFSLLFLFFVSEQVSKYDVFIVGSVCAVSIISYSNHYFFLLIVIDRHHTTWVSLHILSINCRSLLDHSSILLLFIFFILNHLLNS